MIKHQKLPNIAYMKFPFRIGSNGSEAVGRAQHIREQIEQIIFTDPGERVFRPEFGAGLRRAIFEPNNPALQTFILTRLETSLRDALTGIIDPDSLTIDVQVHPDHENGLYINIAYRLAAIALEDSISAEIKGAP